MRIQKTRPSRAAVGCRPGAHLVATMTAAYEASGVAADPPEIRKPSGRIPVTNCRVGLTLGRLPGFQMAVIRVHAEGSVTFRVRSGLLERGSTGPSLGVMRSQASLA